MSVKRMISDELAPRRTNGERRLLAAILARALSDAFSSVADPMERIAAREWIKSDNDEPFSFCWILGELDLDPSKFRILAFLQDLPRPDQLRFERIGAGHTM